MEKVSKLVSLLRHRSTVTLLEVHRREQKNADNNVEGVKDGPARMSDDNGTRGKRQQPDAHPDKMVRRQ